MYFIGCLNTTTLMIHKSPNIYKIGKKNSIYRRYIYNLISQSNYDLFANYLYIETMIILAKNIGWLKY